MSKKIIRLTEKDLSKIVKKVLSERKKNIHEDVIRNIGGTKIGMPGHTDEITINGKKFKTMIDSLVYTGPVVITDFYEDDGDFCAKTNANQDQCFDPEDYYSLVKQVNSGNSLIKIGNFAGKVIFQKIP